ncbi:unnamed protein product [Dovyalis caffra]|uniref:Uncharacterized protein n=1 Tax=Dovyalis caffra TaxID=77055 RepID=A0AAV1R351_9ROSI|nr:unnamed protein product [Dovyalis caffra]
MVVQNTIIFGFKMAVSNPLKFTKKRLVATNERLLRENPILRENTIGSNKDREKKNSRLLRLNSTLNGSPWLLARDFKIIRQAAESTGNSEISDRSISASKLLTDTLMIDAKESLDKIRARLMAHPSVMVIQKEKEALGECTLRKILDQNVNPRVAIHGHFPLNE